MYNYLNIIVMKGCHNMCGITGYIGTKKALPILINSLKKLEYRGYDSAGIAYYYHNKINIKKSLGRISNLEPQLDYTLDTHLGIAHTRWATHGSPNLNNAHPHTQGHITLVHNGIIENYQDLKKILPPRYNLKSTTDSEVVCAYLDYLYTQTNDILLALSKLKDTIQGSYALAIILDNNPRRLFAIKKDSPLIIGICQDEKFLSSDILAILDYTNNYILIKDNDIIELSPSTINIYNSSLQPQPYQILTYTSNNIQNSLGNFDHYMQKEIFDQELVIKNLITNYNTKNKILTTLPDLTTYKKIHIVACGSAYHAGLVGKYLLETYANTEVSVSIASEFRYQKLFLDKNSLVIAISQSGETADTIQAIRIAKQHNSSTLGIVNVFASTIAREVDTVIYTNAGPEVAVATTKGYTSQVFIFSLLTISIIIRNNLLSKSSQEQIFSSLENLPLLIHNTIRKDYSSFVNCLKDHDHIFFLGRTIDYYQVLEASLKLKEVSYLHSESYPAGELKHGTISLIETNTPVISLISIPELSSKTISNIKETISRGATSLIIATNNISIPKDSYNKLITIDSTNPLFQPLINILPFQIIAYELAKYLKRDIDKPRNLAKSVTVE